MAKTRITFFLEPEQAAKLALLSKVTRVPQAAYIREGLDMVFERYKRQLSEGRRKKGGDR